MCPAVRGCYSRHSHLGNQCADGVRRMEGSDRTTTDSERGRGKNQAEANTLALHPSQESHPKGQGFSMCLGHVTNSILASRITFSVSNVIISNATWNLLPVWNELLTLTFSIFQLYKQNMLIIIWGWVKTLSPW